MEKSDSEIKSNDTIKESKTNDSFESYSDSFNSRGVKRMEKLKRVMDETKKGKYIRILFCACIIVVSFVLALDGSTTSNYQPYAASSFGHHSMLSTLSIATSIMSSVSQPIVAKIADVTSRPFTYILILFLYTMGYIICASSSSISAYIVGSVFVTIGSSNIDLINTISLADITPLKYRGFMFGCTTVPYLITVWISGYIVDHFISTSWRWGYGMFAILMPGVLAPCVGLMIYLEHYAQSIYPDEEEEKESMTVKRFFALFKRYVIEGDLFGLILMAFGWALLLLPFSLYSSAIGGYSNPSLIAMFVVGGVLLILYAVYELKFAPFPSMPKRVLMNRTFIVAVIIDFFYMAGEMLLLLYLSSYVGVIKDWSYINWTYFNNALTLSICFFGFFVGLLQRYTHRTKFIQVIGLVIQVVAMIIALWGRYDNANNSTLVWVQILLGMGGAGSNIGSQVASQASVPHQDVALVIALLLQWSTIGYAIGGAIGGAIWETKLPTALRTYIPNDVSDDTITELYSDFSVIQEYPKGTDIRDGSILAYNHVIYYLFAIALGFTVISLVASFFQKNYYLGDTQNGVETEQEIRKPKNKFERVLTWIDNPFKYKEFMSQFDEKV